MVHKFELPKWLLRGIEESFPLRNFDQTLESKIDEANKNKRKLRVKLGIDPTELIFILVIAFCLENSEHFKIMVILRY